MAKIVAELPGLGGTDIPEKKQNKGLQHGFHYQVVDFRVQTKIRMQQYLRKFYKRFWGLLIYYCQKTLYSHTQYSFQDRWTLISAPPQYGL